LGHDIGASWPNSPADAYLAGALGHGNEHEFIMPMPAARSAMELMTVAPIGPPA